MCFLLMNRKTKVVLKGSKHKRLQIGTSGAPGSFAMKIELSGGQSHYVSARILDSAPLMPSTAEARIVDENGNVIHTLRLPDSFIPYRTVVFDVEEPLMSHGILVKGFLENVSRIFWFGFPRRNKTPRLSTISQRTSESYAYSVEPTSQRTDESYTYSIVSTISQRTNESYAYSVEPTISQQTDKSYAYIEPTISQRTDENYTYSIEPTISQGTDESQAYFVEVVEDTCHGRSLSFNTEASTPINSSCSPSKNAPSVQNVCQAGSRSFRQKLDWFIKEFKGVLNEIE